MAEKILVVDDEVSLQETLTYKLEKEGYQVEVAGDGLTALELARSTHPDLVILDVMLPGMDGFEVCRNLRQESNIPVLMLTARDDEIDRVVGLEVGADDYLPKPFDMGELIARIRAMLRRREEYHPDLIRFGDLTLNMRSGEISVGDRSYQLPKQEYRLMEQLMLNHTMYLSTEDLLVKAWGYNTETDINSVWLYISYLRKRLSAMNSKVKIISKRNIGYKLESRS